MAGTHHSGARFGPYEILSCLGINLGEVYLARDPRQGRDVVLKVFSKSVLGVAHFEKTRDELQKEAHVAKLLDHPNILAIYDVGTWSGWLFIAKELLECQTLREQITAQPPSYAMSVAYALQIARVLAAAHERGIVHGNLDPSNVFITVQDCVKILGFGVRTFHGKTFLGRTGYMAPEQVRFEEWDHRADIFAFGAVLHEMLAGACAFRRDSARETILATVQYEPPPLTQLNPQIPPRLEWLVKRCLAKNRAERLASARDLEFELENLPNR